MEGNQADFDELAALLSDVEDEGTGVPVVPKTEDSSSDDDIDDDELDRLAALVQQGDESKAAEGEKSIKSVSDPVPEKPKSPVKKESCESTGSESKEDVAAELRKMQQRIKLLEAQLADGKKEPDVKKEVESPKIKRNDKPQSRKGSSERVTPSPKSGQKIVSKNAKVVTKTSKSPAAQGPRVLKEIDFLSEICPSLKPMEKERPEKPTAKVVQKEPRKVKLTGDDPSIQAKEQSEAAIAAQLFGDDDSDWEELDGESSTSLSKEGEELQQLLRVKSNKGQRVAHQATPNRSSLENKKPTWSSKAPSFYGSPRDGGTSSPARPKKEEEDPNVRRDPFSGIRIVNPLISSLQMRTRMENRHMVKMSVLHQKSKASLEGDWVTMGVVVHKTDPKTSQKGNQFSIWTLSDLVDCEHPVKMFLFGETHKAHWKTTVGTVVGLLNPSPMQSNDKYQNKSDELSITVDHPQKVMPMGTSKDLGFCKSKTKAGRLCLNFINKNSGQYCAYHIQAAYKKVSSKRSELQAAHTGVAPKSFEQKIFAGKGTSFSYGGVSYGNFSGAATTEKAKKSVTVKSLVQHGSKISGKKTTLSLHNILPEDMEKLKREKEAKEAKDHKSFHDMLVVPTAGSNNFVKHLIRKDLSESSTEAAAGSEKDKPIVKSISAKDLLKEHEKNMAEKKLQWKQKQEQRKQAAVMIDLDEPLGQLTSNPLNAVPQLGRGLMGGPSRARNLAAERAKKQAIFAVQEKGGIRKENPNAVKKAISDESREKIRKRLSSGEEEDASCLEKPPHKKSRLLGGLDPDDPEVKKLLAAKSKHSGQLTEMEIEKQEAYFSTLEKKEAMENKMMSIKKLKCKAVSCRKCKYDAFSPLETCKADHPNMLHWHDGVKSFFECKDCKTRTVSLARYPTKPCASCGGRNYAKTTMMKEKTAKKPGEELNLRGEEIKYLNSMK